ncbi:uncharacterized protein EDB91DRAFT_1083715 [Suillus paluster]|uniref:uncharacterized protein n=1 Tax=Suillus paluster TaxID=48578 RepID=UPI001B886CF0|nr:uncharacterized protein EDB91DRAFT_1083715 [Suillus paluster]KAG1735642.1 hypothetical protein EDB91DRAFT_1083715 [Suillus paluster]
MTHLITIKSAEWWYISTLITCDKESRLWLIELQIKDDDRDWLLEVTQDLFCAVYEGPWIIGPCAQSAQSTKLLNDDSFSPSKQDAEHDTGNERFEGGEPIEGGEKRPKNMLEDSMARVFCRMRWDWKEKTTPLLNDIQFNKCWILEITDREKSCIQRGCSLSCNVSRAGPVAVVSALLVVQRVANWRRMKFLPNFSYDRSFTSSPTKESSGLSRGVCRVLSATNWSKI